MPAFECMGDTGQEAVKIDGFDQIVIDTISHGLRHLVEVCNTRDHERLDTGFAWIETLDEFEPGEFRHANVSDDQINGGHP